MQVFCSVLPRGCPNKMIPKAAVKSFTQRGVKFQEGREEPHVADPAWLVLEGRTKEEANRQKAHPHDLDESLKS